MERFADDGTSWPEGNTLHLEGLRYGALVDDTQLGRSKEAKRTATDYERTRKKWLERQPLADLGENFKPQPWTQCADVLRRMGHSHDAHVLLHARDALWLKSKRQDWITRQFYRFVLGPLAGYGYKPYYAVLWALFFVLSGVAVFSAAEAKGLLWPSSEIVAKSPSHALPRSLAPRAYGDFHALVYTLDVFLPVIDLRQEDYWLPRGRGEAENLASSTDRAVKDLTSLCFGIDLFPRWIGATRSKLVTSCEMYFDPTFAWLRQSLDWALDRGFARLWMWVEIFMGWVLLGIVTAGLAGVLHRKTE